MTAEKILDSIRTRRETLAPLVAEYVELVEADRKLTEIFGKLHLPAGRRLRAVPEAQAVPEAPYGYKADGTPRKRRPPSPEALARSIATRRAQATERHAKVRAAKGVRLNVQTVTGPTEREMADRAVAHVTAEPA